MTACILKNQFSKRLRIFKEVLLKICMIRIEERDLLGCISFPKSNKINEAFITTNALHYEENQ